MKKRLQVILLPILLSTAALTLTGQEEAIQKEAVQELTLDQAVEAGLANSYSLAIKEAELIKSGYGVDEARSRLLPSVTFKGSASYMTNPQEGIRIEQGSLGATPSPNSTYPTPFPDTDIVLMDDMDPTYFSLKTSLTQPLFTWGKLWNGLKAAEAEERIAGINREKTRLEWMRDIKLAYVGTQLAIQSRDVLLEAEELFAGMMSDREAMYEEGTITLEELLDVRSQLAEIRSRRVQAEEGVFTARLSLEYQTGLDVSEAVLATPWRSDVPELDEDELIQLAAAESVDLAVLEERIGQAELMEKIEEHSKFWRPDFFLNVSFDVTGQRVPFVPNWLDSWDSNLIITIGTEFSMFDGLAYPAKVKQAQLQEETARLGAAQLKEAIPLLVRRQIEQARVASETAAYKETRQEYLRESLKNARVAFENEMVTRGEYQAAQVMEITSRLDLTMSRFELEQALIQLEYLLGGELPE